MKGEKPHLYLISVLAALILFSLMVYLQDKIAYETPIHDGNGRQLSILDHLLHEERESVERDSRKKMIAGIRINVNRATAGELSLLPGISDETAENIVRYREREGRFTTFENLLNVKGVKRKRLKKILPFIEL